ncbi:hypothetical protein WJX72_001856 [[Myrmecia] bisecta]|uniref:Uncharacterized protein n=1 Tax=[Myrmecia] bisecta TaxID=41462 RepID=A0AAW1QEC1_9CHLO
MAPARTGRRSWAVRAEQKESTRQQTEKTTQEQEEEPVWVRRERERELRAQGGVELPFGVYLLASAIVAIAAVGSIFEFANKNAVFGVIQPDNALYTPILGIFALTGLPTSGWLFFKSIQAANKAAEDMDKLDGF